MVKIMQVSIILVYNICSSVLGQELEPLLPLLVAPHCLDPQLHLPQQMRRVLGCLDEAMEGETAAVGLHQLVDPL